MEETECANICQSIVSGEAGNNATLSDINVQQQCDQYGLNVRPPPAPGAPTPPPPGKANQAPGVENGPPAPEQPGTVKKTFNYFLSLFNSTVLLILAALLLLLSGFFYFTGRRSRSTIIMGLIGVALLGLGIYQKSGEYN